MGSVGSGSGIRDPMNGMERDNATGQDRVEEWDESHSGRWRRWEYGAGMRENLFTHSAKGAYV